MATADIGSDEFVNFKCCLCEKKNITREADNYCVECQDYYCSPCTDLHKMFPTAFGVHQFIDKSSFNTSGLQKSLPSLPVERCTVHSYKLLDMYCADHDDIACTTCTAINHRSCQHIHSVTDEVDDLHKKINFDETNEKLRSLKAKLEESKKGKKVLVKELQVQKANAAESIKHFRNEVMEVLEALENETLRRLEEKITQLRERLECDIKQLEMHIDKLKLSSQKLAQSSGNKAQQFVAVKMSEKNVNEVSREETSLSMTPNCEVEFSAETKIKDVLKDFKTFGLISIKESNRVRNKLYTVKSKKELNIKHPNDKAKCKIIGSCFIDDGLLLLADNENKALKFVDLSSGVVKDYLILDGHPRAICRTGGNEIAVSLNNRKICFISLTDELKTTKQLKFDHDCYGLAYNDGKLFIDWGKSLYIYDMKGNFISKITTDSQGSEIFSDNRHISVSGDGKMIYVTDVDKGLVVLDLEGNHMKTITDPDLVRLLGVCTDKEGNIFVCGWGDSKIVQINEKSGEKLGVIGNGVNTCSTCFDQQQSRLVVTYWGKDFIEMYNLV